MKRTAPILVGLSLGLLSAVAQQDAAVRKKIVSQEQAAEIAGLTPAGEPHVYKKVGDRSLKLFVINPSDWKATDKRPAMVFFHGGGWEVGKGAPTQFNYQGQYLATRGLVCIQVEYRLIADNRKEAPLISAQDAKSSMRWVRSHAAELGIDPDRIGAGGGSAGGHLAAFVGMVEGVDDPQDDLKVSCRPAAMVLYNPALLQDDKGDEKTSASKRPAVAESLLADYKKISPYLNVSADDPPGIILVGDQDNILPIAVLNRFLAKCKAAGVRMDSVVYPGEGHSFFGLRRSFDRFYDTTVEMDKFLASLGWLQGPPTLTKEQVQEYANDAVAVSKKKISK